MRSKPSHPTSCQLLLASMLFIRLPILTCGRWAITDSPTYCLRLSVLTLHSGSVLARNIRKVCLAKPGGSVVAVLGMAHCTGVGKILRESRLV